jgi:hypothetical protein
MMVGVYFSAIIFQASVNRQRDCIPAAAVCFLGEVFLMSTKSRQMTLYFDFHRSDPVVAITPKYK